MSNGKMNHNHAPQAAPKMNAAQLPTMRCIACNNFTFNSSFVIKRVSALISPSGKETMAPIQIFTCVACGTLLPSPGDNLDFIADVRDEDLATDEFVAPDPEVEPEFPFEDEEHPAQVEELVGADAPDLTDEDVPPLKSNLIIL